MLKTSNRMSLRAAINAHCKDCCYDPSNGGTWREQVENCSVKNCSLYLVRPITGVRGVANHGK